MNGPQQNLTLPSVAEQSARLLALGLVPEVGETAERLSSLQTHDRADGSLVVVRWDLLPASALAPHLRLGERRGFVVEDMADVDAFQPRECARPPDAPVYLVRGLDRGDEMRNWSPDEALPEIVGAGRTPLTLTEGIHWVIQQPDALARNHCFMTIGSRLTKAGGSLDARTPALWISNGTGRDGRERRGCPKVGWCWAGNRHTWLGFASAEARMPLPGRA